MKISVIIPVRNEASSIGELLKSLKNQTRLPAEIVITDTGSTDETVKIVEGFDAGEFPIHLIRTAHGMPGRGRNLGAARAENEWLAFIDAGVLPSERWLETLARPVKDSGTVDIVYGSFEPITDTLFEECAAIAFVPPPENVDGNKMRTRSIASALMRKSVWHDVGGFPEDLRSAEDLLFMDKIEAAGFKVAHAPEAKVRWSIQPTLWKTFSRFVSYSRSNIRAGLWAQWQGPIFRRYGMLLLLAVVALFLGRDWLPIEWLFVVLLWLVMMLARSVVAIRRNSECYPAGLGRNFARLAWLVAILVVIDMAAIVGTLQWVFSDRSYSTAARSGT
ncbi:MAG TPA: glycosyltransferase [Pyrinomonadaceae bacterium]|nr:glycosyltransferase [Pyrinomonadaceae bacterium]